MRLDPSSGPCCLSSSWQSSRSHRWPQARCRTQRVSLALLGFQLLLRLLPPLLPELRLLPPLPPLLQPAFARQPVCLLPPLLCRRALSDLQLRSVVRRFDHGPVRVLQLLLPANPWPGEAEGRLFWWQWREVAFMRWALLWGRQAAAAQLQTSAL